MGTKRILFAGNFHWNAGSSHTIAAYAEARTSLGCEIGVSTQLARLDYELQYIGANWWRWEGLSAVVQAAVSADPPLRRIRVCGRWWDSQACPGHERATASEPGWLADRGIEVAPSVPFGRVISEMCRSAISPVLVRPVLARMGLLTPRMFETLAAGSVPVLTDDLNYLTSVYGDEAELFRLETEVNEKLAEMLRDHNRYRRALTRIQDRVYATFNYEHILADLLRFLR
ncbi:MAG: glycosyltransferase family protein [Pseudonocardiaceae bacterium]